MSGAGNIVVVMITVIPSSLQNKGVSSVNMDFGSNKMSIVINGSPD